MHDHKHLKETENCQVFESKAFSDVWDAYKELDINREEISQEKLDLDSTRNASPFNYRGQFSPDFVRRMLSEYSSRGDKILDPFVGCGTTVFEGLKHKRCTFGVEINPCPMEMARLAEFFEIPKGGRRKICKKGLALAKRISEPEQQSFDESVIGEDVSKGKSVPERLVKLLMNRNLANPVRSLLINGFIRFAERGNPKNYYDEVNYFADYVKELPEVKKKWGVFHADARFVPLPTNSINLVLTSPPYINVHNYHQQHRGAMESLGWDLLEVAKSEFGSNRKHRQNRFLTVIQFAIDMYQVFQELKRLVARSGHLIFVVGRSSTIRGVEFNNGRFLTGVAILSGFNLVKRQERKYKNNFGTLIYEDILHFEENRKKARKNKQLSPFQFAKGVLQEALVIAKESTTKKRIDEDIQNAIEKNSIQPSPVFYPESSITNKEIATELSRTGGIIDG